MQTTSFVMRNSHIKGYKGTYCRLIDGGSEKEKESLFYDEKRRYIKSSEDFEAIPGTLITYWISDKIVNAFKNGRKLGELAYPKQGLATSNNDKYLRFWYEVDVSKMNVKATSLEDACESGKKWFPYCKGGSFRKWYGNRDYVIDWNDDGNLLRNDKKAVVRNPNLYFHEGFSYSDVSTGDYALRYYGNGFVFDSTGPMIFLEKGNVINYNKNKFLAVMNSKVINQILEFLCPTIHYTQSAVAKLPLFEIKNECHQSEENILLSKSDWDSFETSWDFKRHPLI